MQPGEGLVDDIQSVLRDHLNVLVDSPDVDLFESGLVDSVGLVELILQLEEHFEVSLPMNALEINEFRSMHTIADLITRLSSIPGRHRLGLPLDDTRTRRPSLVWAGLSLAAQAMHTLTASSPQVL